MSMMKRVLDKMMFENMTEDQAMRAVGFEVNKTRNEKSADKRKRDQKSGGEETSSSKRVSQKRRSKPKSPQEVEDSS